MRFGLQQQLTRQPQQALPVARNTSLGATLVASLVPSIGVNSINNAAVTFASSVSRVATLHGIATQHAASNGQVGIGASGGFSTIVPVGTNWTIFFRLLVTTLGARQIFVGDYDSGGANHSMQIEITAGNLWACEVFTAAGASVPIVGGAVTLGWHDVQLSYTAGTGISLAIDNGAPSVFSFSANLRAGVAFRIGTPGLANTVGFQGRIAACLVFSRDFRDRSGDLSQNPWQVFRAPPSRLWEGATGGATDTPVNPGVGVVALTGYAPTVDQTADQSAAPDAGSLLITGHVPVVTQSSGATASPGVGSVALSGYAPSIAQTANQEALPNAGALVITGYAPAVTQASASNEAQPDAGAIAIVGYAPTMAQSEPPPTKIGGDDVPRDEERIEIWEPRKPTVRRDESLDTVLREAYAKATGKPAAPVAKVEAKVVAPPAPAPVVTDDDDEEDLEILLLSL
jgi:hypothetical protein